MEDITLNAEIRNEIGKGASRRLRKAGKVLGIVYGGKKDAVSIQLSHSDMLKATSNESFYSQVLGLSVEGKKESVVIKDMQRHPWKPVIMHMDFHRINALETLNIRVPIHFVNEEDCIGVKQDGGVIAHLASDIEVTCLPANIPEFIEVDVAALNVGDVLHLADLSMPEGVEITAMLYSGDGAAAVVQVNLPRLAEAEPTQDAEEGAADAPAADESADTTD
jgi:large subunit ribosomal protein L25